MSIRHYCDICGEQARDGFWGYALPKPIPSGDSWDKRVVYVECGAKWKVGDPKNSDPIADICDSCLADGLEKIVKKLRGEQ